MPQYFLKLNAKRPTFAQDMTDDERAIMKQHAAYLGDLMNKGIVAVFGPVFNPDGAFGMGVIEVENEEQVKEIIKNDPASGINNYEYYPMMAILPKK
ncbi:MAG: hypothetical protein JWP37_1337 [Mucilaginibacter sp.]|nr:hypothetical protein [Mucilaginibacter sp.]